MKVYIMVDFEGIAAMIEWDDYVTDTPFNLDKRVDPNGKVLGNQDIEPERSRIQAKRKKWGEERSFLGT